MTNQIGNFLNTICATFPLQPRSPYDFLIRWGVFSTRVPQILGALLSRLEFPQLQFQLAQNIASECGDTKITEMHSRMLVDLLAKVGITQCALDKISFSSAQEIEDTIEKIVSFTQTKAIGFLIGLEAPAYEVLRLLTQALIAMGMNEEEIRNSPYIAVHEVVEKEHQAEGLRMLDLLDKNPSTQNEVLLGLQEAENFWNLWWKN